MLPEWNKGPPCGTNKGEFGCVCVRACVCVVRACTHFLAFTKCLCCHICCHLYRHLLLRLLECYSQSAVVCQLERCVEIVCVLLDPFVVNFGGF